MIPGATLALAVLGGVAPAFAQVEGPCTATFSGVEVRRVDSISSPLEVDVEDVLIFSGTSEQPVASAAVDVYVGPLRVEQVQRSFDATTEFSLEVEIGDIAPYAVGLVKVEATAGECRADGWMRISGRSHFTTLTSVVGWGLLLGGLGAQASGIASRQQVAPLAAALGGVFTGTGLALIGQELGRLQLSYWTLLLFIALAAGFGWFLARLLSGKPLFEGDGDIDDDSALARAKLLGRAISEAGPLERTVRQPIAVGAEPGDPPPLPPKAGPPPYWGFVLEDVDIVDLDAHDQRVATLRPGVWYLVKAHDGLWARVAAGEVEGWAPLRALHHQAEAQERSATFS